MGYKFKIKEIIIWVLIIVVTGSIIISLIKPKEQKITIDDTKVSEEQSEEQIETKKPIDTCYYRSSKTAVEYNDIAWLKLSILDDKISGEFNNYPAQKDSRVGPFEGTVGPLDQTIMGRRANVIWDSLIEGMKEKQELIIEFGDGSATVGFGEMINRGDGVYMYKDETNLFYIEPMSQIDCDSLDEKLFVEKYIRENIASIATNKPILGGVWYVLTVAVSPSTKTGEVIYEDGHIRSKANFIYMYTKEPQSIIITKFEVQN